MSWFLQSEYLLSFELLQVWDFSEVLLLGKEHHGSFWVQRVPHLFTLAKQFEVLILVMLYVHSQRVNKIFEKTFRYVLQIQSHLVNLWLKTLNCRWHSINHLLGWWVRFLRRSFFCQKFVVGLFKLGGLRFKVERKVFEAKPQLI